eukprot:scaffold27019_cov65-Phaeocystis_antarctica.AAC.2
MPNEGLPAAKQPSTVLPPAARSQGSQPRHVGTVQVSECLAHQFHKRVERCARRLLACGWRVCKGHLGGVQSGAAPAPFRTTSCIRLRSSCAAAFGCTPCRQHVDEVEELRVRLRPEPQAEHEID